ncbi:MULTISPECIES: hypothetical protein [Rhodobacterales]|jgi:hypothetical protein|uniref:Uncharacterized protein n=2 Tax=Rhodobacterales TaxID=204455 RepID=A0A1I7DJ29_9RHOB|nr:MULTISPECIES: hypothetical protein [Rhodobacterales]KIN66014.1 DNA replication protein [Sulfitobacter noctilucicola]MBB4175956.1 hypothetical protein [Sulfitobacter noctilucicola]SFU11711.1 hypothetical protein SAMN05216236_1293 [Sedimentitalea nanhaiensis]
MRQKPGTKQSHGEKVVKDIRRATIFEMNVESYRRRTAMEAKRKRGRPAAYATIKNTPLIDAER